MTLSIEKLNKIIEESGKKTNTPTEMLGLILLKAYSYGVNEVLDKVQAEIAQLPIKTRINWDGCCPCIDYPEIEYVDVTKNKLLKIIDKYRVESEES